eukprot:jgi/Mesen1/8774/ME000524S08068
MQMTSGNEFNDTQRYEGLWSWLKDAYGAIGKDVPEHALSQTNLEELHKRAILSGQSTEATKIVTADYIETTREHQNEALRVGELVEAVGLSERELSEQGQKDVKQLARLANTLDLPDTELSSYMVGLVALSQRRAQVEERRAQAGKMLKQLRQRNQTALSLYAQLRRVLEESEDGAVHQEQEMQQWERNLQVLGLKQDQYTKQVAILQAKLERDRYSPEISHGQLTRLSEQLKEVQRKARPVEEMLLSYEGLPPDKELAKLAIEEKKREIVEAQQRLDGQIALSYAGTREERTGDMHSAGSSAMSLLSAGVSREGEEAGAGGEQAPSCLADLPDDFLMSTFHRLLHDPTNVTDVGRSRLVCRRWKQLFDQVRDRWWLREGELASLHSFTRTLLSFPGLTDLKLPRRCLDLHDEADVLAMAVPWHSRAKTDRALHAVALSCPGLASLAVDFDQRPDFEREYAERLCRGCPRLRHLSLSNSGMAALPASLASLRELRSLSLAMPHLRRLLPEAASLTNLTHVVLENCHSLFPEEEEEEEEAAFPYPPPSASPSHGHVGYLPQQGLPALPSLRSVHLERLSIHALALEHLPLLTSLALVQVEAADAPLRSSPFPALGEFKMANCRFDVAECLDLMPRLRCLRLLRDGFVKTLDLVHYADRLETLELRWAEAGYQQEDLPALTTLTSLKLDRCQLVALPETFRQLARLTRLTLIKASVGPFPGRPAFLVPPCLAELRLLEELEMDMMEALQFSRGFPGLAELRVCRLRSHTLHLEPLFFDRHTKLEALEVVVRGRQRLVPMFSLASNMKTLALSEQSLLRVPAEVTQSTSIRSLRLIQCASLESVGNDLGDMAQLQRLEISGCSTLTSLPDSLGQLESLLALRVVDCPSFRCLPHSIGTLSRLYLLHLSGCPLFTSFPPTLNIHRLTDFVFEDCGQAISPNSRSGGLAKRSLRAIKSGLKKFQIRR